MLGPLILTKFGKSKLGLPNSSLTHEPSDGWVIDPVGEYPVCMRYCARWWLPSLLVMPRTMERCCAWSARFGRCSLISMPATRVLIDLNCPPVEVPGFGSNVSKWLGPPFIHNKMQFFAFGAALPWA